MPSTPTQTCRTAIEALRWVQITPHQEAKVNSGRGGLVITGTDRSKVIVPPAVLGELIDSGLWEPGDMTTRMYQPTAKGLALIQGKTAYVERKPKEIA